ncbi:peptide-binding protein [Natranaerobius thermophilus]|uniref:Extracellular solute-binding protein family 5 n=1 Tax=Natranaerobius thermophilus (strain ATCC BAA-1301 / DSM 18059 / JW/NM-WN-LF) TaxID=457570 RepID=B2A2X8_NATTJ|nr:peptide-binding protein [Natranaerobius thermophilus]ACB86346.1 extracellular solute-binding protein family 5 [Natranaerobius thermophilus JW/NM-WN-LF]
MRKLLILLLVVFVASFGFMGCDPADPEEIAEEEEKEPEEDVDEEEEELEQAITHAIWSEPDGLFNYCEYESTYDLDAFNQVFDGMMEADPHADLELNPNLAEEHEISDDGKTFYYKLRDDIEFHDGEPLTAEDVKFTFEWMCHEDYIGPRASYWQHLEGFDEYRAGEADEVEGIEIISDHEIEFHFEQVDASAVYYVSTWGISPKHVWEDIPVGERREAPEMTEPIGTGPFEFEEYVEGQYVELVANEDYHRGEPELERITVEVKSPDVVRADLETGEVDIAEVPPDESEWDDYEAHDELALEYYPTNGYQYMGMNLRDESIFSDHAVREAATYAINREGMVDGILDGLGKVQNSHFSPNQWAYDEDLDTYPHDPDKAEEILEDAGYTKNDDGIWEQNGEPLEFTLLYPTGDEPREQAALIIEQDLQGIGIDITLESLEFATLSDRVFDEIDFDAYLMGWSLGADPDPTGIWGPDERFNAVGFVHPESDELMEQGLRTTDRDERREHYVEWQRLLQEEMPYVFLYADYEGYAYNNDIQVFEPNPWNIWYDVHEWYLE